MNVICEELAAIPRRSIEFKHFPSNERSERIHGEKNRSFRIQFLDSRRTEDPDKKDVTHKSQLEIFHDVVSHVAVECRRSVFGRVGLR